MKGLYTILDGIAVLPKRLERGDKVFFATKGKIRGFFKIHDICGNKKELLRNSFAYP